MQTHFSAQQLADPALAEAAGVIRSCVRHGFCPQTCPTYVLLGDENESPRGRIDLMRDMLEQGGTPSAATVRHLDHCLSCLSCETTCAARVDYRHLIDHARAHIERHFRRPWRERWLRAFLARVLPHPARLRVALALARLASPLAPVLPPAIARLVTAVPPQRAGAHTTAPAPAAAPASGPRLALLEGCVQQVMGADIHAAAVRVLERHGCTVVAASAAHCCGALTLHMGREAQAHASARALIDHWHALLAADRIDVICVTTSGCGTTIKDYGRLFAHDPVLAARAAAVAARTRDISEILATLPLAPQADRPRLPLAYHDACSLQHGQGVRSAPRAALRAAGFRVHDVPEGHFCCGSAGTYNLLQPALAETLGRRKAAAIASTGAAAVAAGNLGCLLQIGRYGAQPLAHTVELIDWATGGPCPAALRDLDVSAWLVPDSAPPAPAAPAATEEEALNFWLYQATAATTEEFTHGS